VKVFPSFFFGYVALFLSLYSNSSFSTQAVFETWACEKTIDEPSVNAIVEEVFNVKAEKLANDGKLSNTFWMKNKELKFAICDNSASYDTFVVYGKGVVFDYQMIAFLFAQSRALIVGRYISRPQQFDVHMDLVRQFVNQGSSLEAGPLAIIKRKALELGISKDAYENMLADTNFKRREQTIFLQALYFLSMHERCHVALDHGTQLNDIKNMSGADKRGVKQQLELDADQCAIEIINVDEAKFKSSPISFFGLLMTVATQSIISNHPSLVTDRSHPSTRKRLAIARDLTLEYISKLGVSDGQNYEAAIKGTATYFDSLLTSFEISL